MELEAASRGTSPILTEPGLERAGESRLHVGVIVDEATEFPGAQCAADQIRLRHHRRRAGHVEKQPDLTEVVTRRQGWAGLAAHRDRRRAVEDHEERKDAGTPRPLADDDVARSEMRLPHVAAEALEVIPRQPGEE